MNKISVKNSFMTVSEIILFFRTCWCGSGNGHFIIGTNIDFMTNMKTKLFYKMCKCGSGNEHCVRGTEIGYTPLRRNKTGILNILEWILK